MEPVGDCAVNILKYFFNQTSQMCERFLWNGCLSDGVFETRCDCVRYCHRNERAGVCAQRRPDNCAELKAKGKRLPRSSMDAWYYDLQRRRCMKFQFCGPSVPIMSNYFTTLTVCMMECRGLPIYNPE
ncbi:hypothetical protein V5799_002753 [Amblyomma americanum]|uniref:BPTI/Kunitz inhibitor domain-containing protein n=1 Tax=Amblyomma americanum TaxID=6943 RepID=A0AAQ4DAX6_AMBAM